MTRPDFDEVTRAFPRLPHLVLGVVDERAVDIVSCKQNTHDTECAGLVIDSRQGLLDTQSVVTASSP